MAFGSGYGRTTVSALALLAVPAAALAQTAPADRVAEAGLDDIVVTAEKRASTVQDAPLSIRAVTGDSLAQAGVRGVDQLAVAVPGLQVSRTGPNGFPFLRGLGTAINPIGADPSVAVYVDGLYRPRTRDSLVEFLDVDRVEVLKGPQGTLYGRNAVGGAINVIGKAPANEFQASIVGEYGNYDAYKVTGIVNAPIVDGKLAARVALRRSKRDGFVQNIAPGALPELENQDAWQGRASLLFTPSEAVRLLLFGSFFRDDTNGFAFRATIPGFSNYPRDVLGATQPTDPRTVSNDFVNPARIRSQVYGAELNLDVSDKTALQLRVGYARSSATESIDRDDTAIAFSYLSAADVSDSYQAELVVNTDLSDRLRLTAGATYFIEDVAQSNNIGYGIPLTPPNVPVPTFIPGQVLADIDFSSEAAGAFVQGTYDVTDDTRITAGLRYSWERKSYSNQSNVGIGAPPSPVPRFADANSWRQVTWLARVEHDLDPTKLLYASVSTGFKSGGFNTAVSQQEPAFDPEDILALEAGLKSSWLDDRLTFNVAAFYYDYKNIQVQKIDPADRINSIENASRAEIYGLDASLRAQPVAGLELELGTALLRARFKDYETLDPTEAAPQLQDLSGNSLARSPTLTLSGAVSYSQDLGSAGSLTGRVDGSYQTSFYFRAFEKPFDREPPYALVNARLTYQTENDRISVSVFAQNLFDKLYRVNLGDPPFPDIPGNYYGAPRTYGVSIGFSY